MVYTIGTNMKSDQDIQKNTRGEEHDHQHQHYWHDCYDAPLGQPVGDDETKA